LRRSAAEMLSTLIQLGPSLVCDGPTEYNL
jgi:hypothetical protein